MSNIQNSLDEDYKKAYELFKNREYNKAIDIYNNLLLEKYNENDVIAYIVCSYIGMNDFDSCIEIFNDCLTDDKDSNNDNLILDSILNVFGELNLDEFQYDLYKAKIFIQFKRFDSAYKYLDKVLDICPDDTEALKLKAILLFNQDKLNLSLEYLDKILRINPDDYLALEYKGYVFVNSGRAREAIPIFKKVLSFNNKNYNIWRQYYFAYAYCGKLNKALEKNRAALSVLPDQYELWIDRYQLFDDIGDKNNARKTLYKLKELNPDLFNKHLSLNNQ